MPYSRHKNDSQDTLLNQPNISFYALPQGGRRWDYFKRKRKIAQTCKAVSPHYDALLIRGITPRQWTVWQNCKVSCKAFLLVGSLQENRPPFSWKLNVFLTWVLTQVRRWEFGKIAASEQSLLFANSPALVQEIQKDWGAKALFVSTNTIKVEQIGRLVFKKINTPCCLLFVGRVVRDKGIEDLIEALALLNSKREHSFVLKIIGNAEITYKAHLERMASELGVADYIGWEGFVPFGESLLQQYRAADFLVLPSWHEGFPHCIWEAAATSTPVIVTAVGGIPGLVDNSMVTFVHKHSPEDIASKIVSILSAPKIRWEKVERLHTLCHGFTVEFGAKTLADILTKK